MTKKIGRQTLKLQYPPTIAATAAVVGQKEGQGPLKRYFDYISYDSYFGEKTWEKAETAMLKQCFSLCCDKGKVAPKELDFVFSGDLLNQCVGSAFAMKDSNIPYFGLYGACSTMGEALTLGAMTIDGGFASTVCALTSSHFCSSERQYRFPLGYGGQRTPTAQWTVTGSGAALVRRDGHGPRITGCTVGTVTDLGIKDANNMGAAMAPAAYATIKAHFDDMKTAPEDFDLIVTGDLGQLGKEMLLELARRDGVSLGGKLTDCGTMVFDNDKQDVHAGGSGCGCSAITLCGYLLGQLNGGKLKKILAFLQWLCYTTEMTVNI